VSLKDEAVESKDETVFADLVDEAVAADKREDGASASQNDEPATAGPNQQPLATASKDDRGAEGLKSKPVSVSPKEGSVSEVQEIEASEFPNIVELALSLLD
jgi:hypothetical protein